MPSAGWADSVTGGGWAAATGTPILVTGSEELHPAVEQWLAADGPSETVLLGGTAALSGAVGAAVPAPRRVAGADRAATAVAIAEQLWDHEGGPGRFVVINGYRDDGWAFGLAAAGLAADAGAPLLVVGDSAPDATVDAINCDDELLLIGDDAIVSGDVEQRLLEVAAC